VCCEGQIIEAELTFKIADAISISDLVRIRSDETFRSILEHLSADKFVKCSYDDCLTPSYSIPGLIASLLDSVNSTDQFSYET
jgi:hypothetical protein